MKYFVKTVMLIATAAILITCDKGEEVKVAPVISSISPIQGLGGTEVKIFGTGFSAIAQENTVRFNGVSAEVISANETEITTKSPIDAGQGAVTVEVNGSLAISPIAFKELHRPEVLHIYPKNGAVGSTVIIETKYLSSAIPDNIIKIGGRVAEIKQIIDFTFEGDPTPRQELTCVVPPLAESGKISISANGLEALSTEEFTVHPIITDFTPKGGGENTPVTITGLNFSSVISENFVAFGGSEATITFASKTELHVIVPATAKFGVLYISTNDRVAYSADFFVAPKFYGPASASVGELVNVYIAAVPGPEGTIVRFNGVQATEVNTSQGIIARVPVGATTGKITIEYEGFVSESIYTFTID